MNPSITLCFRLSLLGQVNLAPGSRVIIDKTAAESVELYLDDPEVPDCVGKVISPRDQVNTVIDKIQDFPFYAEVSHVGTQHPPIAQVVVKLGE